MKHWHSARADYPPYYTTYFIASYFFFTSLGFTLWFLFWFLTIMTIAWAPLRAPIWDDYLGPYCVAYSIYYIWSSLIFRNYIYGSVITDNGSVVMPRLFLFLDIPLSLYQVLLASYSALFRLIYMLLFTLASMVRMDISGATSSAASVLTVTWQCYRSGWKPSTRVSQA